MKVLYLYTDPLNDIPRYVGMGTETRPYNHIKRSTNPKLGNMINKRIRDGYVVEPKILCIGEEGYIKDLEIKLIAAYGREDLNEGTLFNYTDGGDGIIGYNHTEEHKNKMSERMKGKNNSFYGKTHSEKMKTHISNSLKGDKSPRFGKKHSKESIEKMIESSKGVGIGKESGRYQGYYVTPFGEFFSLKSAYEDTHIPTGTIYRWCKNSNTTINSKHIGHSDFLVKDDLGKTFKELGYDFIPKEK